ncbi:efflux RND transporter permease subunit [Candidatus Contendibacter odensensis]|uniref:Acriflavin resistance protein n=1 Tax=Candidatus Contendobacter odensis Run_B_J11 TaxID=1400861 RepID=A0A7U7GDL4_9GAMM|nr:efflux RND transporter permease subunit [Candidatus Contendobacter odensis]CDH46450.1 Acriflavin resistance protein [Candidatus Contendobacter odensis Run_B_J11]
MSDAAEPRLGLSGAIAKKFLLSEITPLLALVGLLLGVLAVLVTPREEEPQINVTFANVFIPFPGATAQEVEKLVSNPAEQMLAEIEGVEHIYSVSRPGMAVLTVQFKVGEPRTDAIVRLYNKLYSNADGLPPHLGVGQAIVKPKGIDDVPIVSLTLWTEDPQRSADDLARVAHTLETELKRVPGTRDLYTIGAPDRVVRVRFDPAKLSGYGLALSDLRSALQAANASTDAGALVSDNREIPVQAGSFLVDSEDIGSLVVGLHQGTPVYLADVAEVTLGPDQPERSVWLGTGPAAKTNGINIRGEFPAVTLAIAKKPGENAVRIADQVIARVAQLQGTVIPEGVNVTVTRNYGVTANDKAVTLITKLIFATGLVIVLVLFALGWREAFIVGAAVILTLTITLFASWAWGFTLNRVSLFALIFSIGILVDDAIVVVENIHRHIQLGGRSLVDAIPLAVDEVGGPTILATFTVIAALLPMAFVSGLMGPYMSPIPINSSMGMLISLAVAFVFTPWLTYKVLRRVVEKHQPSPPTPLPPGAESEIPSPPTPLPPGAGSENFSHRLFRRVVGPFLRGNRGRPLRWLLGISVLLLIGGSVSLAYFELVVLKMLPFDNKSEFQVIVDMPEGTTLEQTARVLGELGRSLSTVEEVTDYQVYAGTAAPINFNGLVRQYYLRAGANVGDIQVNLVDKKHRQRKSHEIALAVRGPLQEIGQRYNANVKVVEVPPGPPVMAPLVAEVYGLNYPGQIQAAQQVRAIFSATPDIIDVDDTVEDPAERLIAHVDRAKAALLGVSQQAVAADLNTALRGEDVSYLHSASAKYPIPLRLELPTADKAAIAEVLSLKTRSQSGSLVPLSEIVDVEKTQRENAIYHKDLLPVVFVFGDMAGPLDSPLYGMFEIFAVLRDQLIGGGTLEQSFIRQPDNPYGYSLKWDGEWQITYETFRDMGIAYGVGMILIYLLVVVQFRSYLVPLIIMAPIPLTLIGVMPGHALLHAQFTATSMIGMIALAGIIVRNSILLVDFINLEVANGMPFQEAVIRSSAVRAKPIILTALAAMLGALFILDDPIFRGLAISLIFGIMVSTVLTLVFIPVLYYAAFRRRLESATS